MYPKPVFVTLALCVGLAVSAPTDTSEKLPAVKRDDGLRFPYGDTKVRGVNLGGWFVLEPWITPSIFEEWADGGGVVDEYTLTQTLGEDEAKSRLSDHWNSWITRSDFYQIKKAGLNHVRIPIGYWSIYPIEGDPYVQGAYDVLGEALDWASDAGLKVMIDLHGAPGSQNGFDNSGRKGDIDWTSKQDYVTHTKLTLNKVRDDYASHPAVAAIELVNEPMGANPAIDMDTVRQFYMDGWGNLKGSNVAVTFHDAFIGVTAWNDWGDGMWNLLLDTHHYEVFDSSALQMGIDDHVDTACGFGDQMASNNKWTVAGEWSGAQTDCAKWLNGLGIGARYDGTYSGSSYIGSCDGKYTGKVADLGQADKDNIRRYIEAQISAFEKGAGWIFWTWKTEGAPEWDMQDLLANNIFPQPLTAQTNGDPCA